MESILMKNKPMPTKHYALIATGIIVTALVGVSTTPYMAAATLAYFLIVAGFTFRKSNPKTHAYLMGSGITLDLSLVLVLEAQRSAIATAMGDEMTLLQQAHVGFSVIAVLCYIPLIAIGLKLLKGEAKNQTWHKWLGICAFAARTIGFLLMFSLLERVITP